MARKRTGRIAFAQISMPPSFSWRSRDTRLSDALVPGTAIERYGREWRIGGVGTEDGFFEGRIGFERVTGSTEVWDDRAKDFTTAAVRQGATSAFSIDVDDLVVSFQLRPGLIKRTSFTGAFEELLTEGSQVEGWKVEPFVNETTFADFVGSVDRLKSVRIRAELPNPNWKRRQSTKRLFDAAKAKSMTLDIQEVEGEGVELEHPLLEELILHTAELDYGYTVAHGVEDGQIVTYDSRNDNAPPEAQAAADPESGEVPFEALRQAVRDLEVETDDQRSDGPQQ